MFKKDKKDTTPTPTNPDTYGRHHRDPNTPLSDSLVQALAEARQRREDELES